MQTTQTTQTTIPFDRVTPPHAYIGVGWTLCERPVPGAKAKIARSSSVPGTVEIWSHGDRAELRLPLAAEPLEPLYVTLNLRSCAVDGRAERTQTVVVAACGRHLAEHRVPSAEAMTKLIVVPTELVAEDRSLRLTLQTPEATSEQAEVDDWPRTETMAIELSALAVYTGRQSFLASVEAEFRRASAARDELFDRGAAEVLDRGELIDNARMALENAQRLDEVDAAVIEKLEAFLADPYVRARRPVTPAFDEAYFRQHEAALTAGRVQQLIRRWAGEVEEFRAAVVDLGNRAFLRAPQNEGDDRLLHAIEEIDAPAAQLGELKAKNERLNDLEVLLRRDGLESIPPALEIELSSHCNYACVMCGRSYLTFALADQTDRQLARLLDAIPYLRHVTIAGVGENTMSDRLAAFAAMLDKFAVESRIFTNGSLIDRQLDAMARFTKVCVSFDGATPETFQAQRRGADLAKLLDNIRLLRRAAPQQTLAFSVVVSRLNVDEIVGIFEHAARLGVDHVALSPVWDRRRMTLKPSDRALFHDQLAVARTIAERHGIEIQNNVADADFHVHSDEPRDKAALIEYFSTLDFPSLHIPALGPTVERFQRASFHYYPPPEIWPDGAWPAAPAAAPITASERTSRRWEVPPIDLGAAIQRLDRAIEVAEAELAARPAGDLTLPYCLSIWKYMNNKANGKNRLCSQRDIDVGSVVDDGYRAVVNGERNRLFRRSMFSLDDLQDHCRTCTDPFRQWDVDRIRQRCAERGLEVADLTTIRTAAG